MRPSAPSLAETRSTAEPLSDDIAELDLPEAADLARAARRLAGVAVETPLLENPLVNDRVGGRLLLKAETLQRTGSFKFRGAYARIAGLDAQARARGVVAYSSGNHAQGVAAAARALGAPATIVMPADAPAIKAEGVRAYGAEIVAYDRRNDDRVAIAHALAAERGLTLVPPYDDKEVIAGQGTVGLEIMAQAQAMGASPDLVVTPCGGGGLTAGIGLGLDAHAEGRSVELWMAEPEAFDDTSRSLALGRRLSNAPDASSICDSLQTMTPGLLTFALNRRRVQGGVTASDAEVRRAMVTLFRDYKLVVEPGGAVALAAVLAGRLAVEGRTVVVVLSGANVDPALFADIIAKG